MNSVNSINSINSVDDRPIAWLLPTMGRGGISWQHLLCEFTKMFPHTLVFTGEWAGYVPGFEQTFKVQEVGKTKFIETKHTATGYGFGFSYVSPYITQHLLQFKPHIVFANAFSLWTLIALLLKPVGGWRVIITYEGSSPHVDYQGSPLRLLSRKIMVKLADALIANSQAGKHYLIKILGANPDRVFARPFLVPSIKALTQQPNDAQIKLDRKIQRPIFLYVGQIVARKGVKTLLEACAILQTQGYRNYTLLILGEGDQQDELERLTREADLIDRVIWLGKIEYGSLASYFKLADVFIFPTYEDIWGMVLPEAMIFSKPVLCSREAGAVELMEHGKNGFVFNPHQPVELANYMKQFIDRSSLIKEMGQASAQIMTAHTPEIAIRCFTDAVQFAQRQ